MRIENPGERGRLPYVLVTLAVAFVLSIMVVQTVSAADTSQKINGCYVKSGKNIGKFRILPGTSTTCKSTETPIS